MAKLADSDVTGATGAGKQILNKQHNLTTSQLLIGAVVFYLFIS